MTDREARIFVAQSMFDALVLLFPQSNKEKLREAAKRIVDVTLNAYQEFLEKSPTEDKEPS